MRLAGFVLIPLILFLAGMQSASRFVWKDDFDQALVQAKTENKPLVVFFFHSYYYQNPGKLREDFQVWNSPLVTKYASDFIPVKMNVEEQENIETQFGVLSFPTVLFFDPQGRELKAFSIHDESLKKEIISVNMKKVLQSIENFTLIEQQIKTNDSNPKLVLMYANGLRDRGMFERAEEQYYRLLHWNGLDAAQVQEIKSAYTNLLFFQGSADFYGGDYGRCIETMQRFIAKNPKNEALPQAKLLLGMSLYQNGSKTEGEKILKELSRDKNAGPIQDKAKNYLLNPTQGGVRR